ncbi:MAG TPA: molybdenum cofactor guanylyltransferase [Polyangia bacterium]|nr:molybdenum cofactor guanylyltransferase [Polyangia bacterium]
MTCAAAILAGGQATRMGGRPKSFLLVGGARVIERQLPVLRGQFDELLIVANDGPLYEPFGLPVVPDLMPGGFGPLIGILSALEAARSDQVLCVACDMPFLDPRALALVRDHAPAAEVVVPMVGGREEPLHARYARSAASAIRAQLASGDYKVSRFFERVHTVRLDEDTLRALDPTLHFLQNVNTPDELAALE